MKVAIVTAMIEPEKTKEFWGSWLEKADLPGELKRIVVMNGGELSFSAVNPLIETSTDGLSPQKGTLLYSPKILGPVPAFAWGVAVAAKSADVIACFHDDMQFLEKGWDTRLRGFFESYPECILAGFGGGRRLGRPGMYEEEYDPMSLARHDFRSNMRDAEAHGMRVTIPWPVAVLDGFSMIGRRGFFERFWREAVEMGLYHHAYDALAGIAAKKAGGEVWILPERVHHAGGRSAVANQQYQEWAREKHPKGDQGFWEESHRKVWEAGKGILPIGWGETK